MGFDTCEHHTSDNLCMISTVLAKLPVAIDAKACDACRKSRNPREVNGVTCSRATSAIHQSGLPIDPDLLRCVRAEDLIGPGTVLKNTLSFWADVTNDCGCKEKAVMMNRWGVDGCLQRIDEITGWLVDGANNRYPWLRYVPKRWYLKHLAKKAIRNAGRTRVSNQSHNPA